MDGEGLREVGGQFLDGNDGYLSIGVVYVDGMLLADGRSPAVSGVGAEAREGVGEGFGLR